MRSERARQLLTELMPRLLEAFAKTANPDAAFARFDEFLGRLPAGVQLFSLFHAYPALLDIVAEIMGDAPRLADWLSHNPHLLDHVLRSEEHTSELQSLMRTSYAVFCLKKKIHYNYILHITQK